MAVDLSSRLIVDLESVAGIGLVQPRYAATLNGYVYLAVSEASPSPAAPVFYRIDSAGNVTRIVSDIPNAPSVTGLGVFNGRLVAHIAGQASDDGFYSSVDAFSWVQDTSGLRNNFTGFFAAGPSRVVWAAPGTSATYESTDGVVWSFLGNSISPVSNFEGGFTHDPQSSQFVSQGATSSGAWRRAVVSEGSGPFPSSASDPRVLNNRIDDDGFSFPTATIFYEGQYYHALTSAGNVRRTSGLLESLLNVVNVPRSPYVTPGAVANANYVMWSLSVVNGVLLGKSPARVDYYDPETGMFEGVTLEPYMLGNNTVRNPTAVLDGGYYVTFDSRVYRIDASIPEAPPEPPRLLGFLCSFLPKNPRWALRKNLRAVWVAVASELDKLQAYAVRALLDLYPQHTRNFAAFEEREGLPAADLDDDARRLRILTSIRRVGSQSPRYIQNQLRGAGFDVYVYDWFEPNTNPPVLRNPLSLLRAEFPLAVYGNPNMVYGASGAVYGATTPAAGDVGFPLVNVIRLPGGGRVEYQVPPVPEQWPYFWYVGGPAFGEFANVPVDRRNEFEELLLQIGPQHLWIGAFIRYV